tara:strand:+ start:2408 stop:2710 length:303 start_codon:yes stop_codon:yes gene_type:complete
MKIEILKDHAQPVQRVVNIKKGPNEGQQKTITEQTAFIHLGGPYPVEFKINLDTPADAYPAGEYTMAPSCFRVNGYGSLEVNRFDFRLVAVKSLQAAKTA